MGKGKPRWGAEYCIEDDSRYPNDDWKNEDPEKLREDFKEMYGMYPEEFVKTHPPLKRRTWYDD